MAGAALGRAVAADHLADAAGGDAGVHAGSAGAGPEVAAGADVEGIRTDGVA
jgi:hypothetical protein